MKYTLAMLMTTAVVTGTVMAQEQGRPTAGQGASATRSAGANTGTGTGSTAGTGAGASRTAGATGIQGAAGSLRGGVGNGEPRGAFSDALFVAAAAAAGMAEVGTSKLAVQQGGCDEVKMFAQRMIDDHTKANRELMALASQKNMQVPTGLSIQDQATANALSGLSGEEFDCAYSKDQHAAHICAVNLFTAEAERGRDPEIRAWAAKTLPTLKEHKIMIKRTCEAHEKKEAEKSAK